MTTEIKIVSVFYLCIALFTFNLYATVASGGFKYDSAAYLTLNPYLNSASIDLNSLHDAAFNTWGSLSKSWRPLTDLSFALNSFFHGNQFKAYHLTNLCLHIFTGFIVGLFIRNTLTVSHFSANRRETVWVSSLATAIWLTHPVLTQAVNYIYQRSTLLATFFYFLSLLFYIKGRLKNNRSACLLFYFMALISGVLAFGSKEISATLPFTIILYEWIFFQEQSQKWLKTYLPKIIILLAVLSTLFFLFMGDQLVERIVSGYERHGFSMGQRLFTEFRVVVFYMSQLLFPHPSRLNLVHEFPLSQSFFDPVTTLLSFLLILSLLTTAAVSVKKFPVLAFCIFCFFGNLVIESTIIPAHIIFEHRLYLPSVFFVFSITILAWQFLKNKYVYFGLFLLIFVIQSFWTYERNRLWGNNIEFWEDCVRKSPSNPMATVLLAEQHLADGNMNEAMSLYKRILKQNPPSLIAGRCFSNLGYFNTKQYSFATAEACFKKALLFFDGSSDAHFQLGAFYNDIGSYKKAMLYYRLSLEKDRNNYKSAHNLKLLEKRRKIIQSDLIHLIDKIRSPDATDTVDFFKSMIDSENKKTGAFDTVSAGYKKERILESIEKYVDKANHDVKLFLFKAVLEIDPSDSRIMCLLIREYAAMNEKYAAVFWLRKAKTSGFDDWRTFLESDAYQRLKDIQAVNALLEHRQNR